MQPPLFQLFRTINSHYIYDTNKNQIYPISEACSDILSQVKRGELSVQEAGTKSDEIKDLCARGLLSDNRVETLEHPYTSILHPLLTRRIQKVTLQLTQNCNFRCSYCHYTSNTGNQRLHANPCSCPPTPTHQIQYDQSSDGQTTAGLQESAENVVRMTS